MADILKKLFYILPAGDWIKLIILFVLMLGVAVLEVAGIGMIPAFISIISTPEKILESAELEPLLSYLKIVNSKDLLLWGSCLLVAIFILKNIYLIIYNYIQARFVFNRRYTVSQRLMTSYMYAPYTFHLKKNTAELLRNVTTEVNILVGSVLINLLTLSKEAIMVVSIIIFLLIVEPLVTLLVFGISGAGIGSFLLFTRKKVTGYGVKEQQHRANLIKAVNQGLGGLKGVRVMNREPEFIEKFRSEAFKSSRLLIKIQVLKQLPKPIADTSAVVTMTLIAAILIWQGRSVSSIIPVLSLFAMATVRLMPAFQTIASMVTNLTYNIVSLNPVYNDIKEVEKFEKDLLTDRNKNNRLELKVEIKADNVSFYYPESKHAALEDISFKVEKGMYAAFVGASGAGKTTLIDVLLGLIPPSAGKVSVDGNDIQSDLSAWQRNLGYIPQSIYIADEPLRNNIAFGVPDNEINNHDVMKAVKSARLSELLNDLPDGLDTIVGENGARLSGGQKQRVGIARALYHQPQVLVMDEATSALDNITEKEVIAAIDNLRGEQTVIMIAHRLTTVKNCDILFLMQDGKIIDSGSYRELAENNKEFRKMALID